MDKRLLLLAGFLVIIAIIASIFLTKKLGPSPVSDISVTGVPTVTPTITPTPTLMPSITASPSAKVTITPLTPSPRVTSGSAVLNEE